MSQSIGPQFRHLRILEAESIHILREVAATYRNPAILYSVGKGSSVLLHLTQKAFFPGRIPFALLHIDTGHLFPESYDFLDKMTENYGEHLMIVREEDQGGPPRFKPTQDGMERCCAHLKTHALLEALAKHGFDAALNGARRDEEQFRAKEGIFSVRDEFGQWNPKEQRPEIWNLFNTEIHENQSARVFPLSNWTEKDIWQYIQIEAIPVVPLYFAKKRRVIDRGGVLIPLEYAPTAFQGQPHGGVEREVFCRFRSLGCIPCTGAIESSATTLEEIQKELFHTHPSDLQFHEAPLEQNKAGGGLLSMTTKSLLRITTTGGVDDGKSTLLGRLLLETNSINPVSFKAIKVVCKCQNKELDTSIFPDGLCDEPAQEISVSYHYFETENRKFIVADTPGQEQYTQNMIAGSSTANVAIILIDARKGLVTQSKRHGFLLSLLHIPHLVVAINKMDLVDYSQSVFETIVGAFQSFVESFSFASITFIPISAKVGDNITQRSRNMPWYGGETLLYHLEQTPSTTSQNLVDFRLPIQLVLRPHQDFRGFAGQIVSGHIRPGEKIVVLPSGQQSTIKSLVGFHGNLEIAKTGEDVVVTLEDELDISRGDIMVRPNNLPSQSRHLNSYLCWMDQKPSQKSSFYLLKHGTKVYKAFLQHIHYRFDINTMHRIQEVQDLQLNDIGRIDILTTEPLYFDPFASNKGMGSFILIDPQNHHTVAAGMIRGKVNNLGDLITPKSNISTNVQWQDLPVAQADYIHRNGHKPAVVWLTGLSGSGKSSIAQSLVRTLFDQGHQAILLDGDNVRHGLCGDLGFTLTDREENIRRVGEVAKLFYQSGHIVVCTFISPFRQDRDKIRHLLPPGGFIEVFINCPLEVCIQRDVKGLYAKALRGEIKDFTGISSPYEEPQDPEMVIASDAQGLNESVDMLIEYLRFQGILRHAPV